MMRILLLSLLCALNLSATSYPYADRVITYLTTYKDSFCTPELRQCEIFTMNVMLAKVICGQCPNIGGNKNPHLLINNALGQESGLREFCDLIIAKKIPYTVCGFQDGLIIK